MSRLLGDRKGSIYAFAVFVVLVFVVSIFGYIFYYYVITPFRTRGTAIAVTLGQNSTRFYTTDSFLDTWGYWMWILVFFAVGIWAIRYSMKRGTRI